MEEFQSARHLRSYSWPTQYSLYTWLQIWLMAYSFISHCTLKKCSAYSRFSIAFWTGQREIVKWSEVAQSCPTLCDSVDYSSPGSSVHGILQARILEWVAISFSRGSSRPRDRTQVSRIAGRRCNLWATREATKRNKASPFPMAKAIGQYENRKMKMYDCKDHTLGNHTSLWANSE